MAKGREASGFVCFKCGCCCTSSSDVPQLRGLLDRTGNCRYFDPETRECQIYDDRPDACRLDAVFKTLPKGVSWEDFVYTSMLDCVYLRWSQGVPEPDDSPFRGRQEQVARAVERALESMLSPSTIQDNIPSDTPLRGGGGR